MKAGGRLLVVEINLHEAARAQCLYHRGPHVSCCAQPRRFRRGGIQHGPGHQWSSFVFSRTWANASTRGKLIAPRDLCRTITRITIVNTQWRGWAEAVND